jgi:AcrR family transcriptional regulator
MAIPTREHILSAAAKLYAEHGFRGTTTRAVAEAAGVNEVTLFRIFGSKVNIIVEAMRAHGVPVHVGTLPETPVDPLAELTEWTTQTRKVLLSLRSMIRQAMSDAEANPEMPRCVARGAEATYTSLWAYLERAKAAGFLAPDADTHSAGGILIGAMKHDALSREFMPQFFPPIATAPAIYARLCLLSLGYDAARAKQAQPRRRAAS